MVIMVEIVTFEIRLAIISLSIFGVVPRVYEKIRCTTRRYLIKVCKQSRGSVVERACQMRGTSAQLTFFSRIFWFPLQSSTWIGKSATNPIWFSYKCSSPIWFAHQMCPNPSKRFANQNQMGSKRFANHSVYTEPKQLKGAWA